MPANRKRPVTNPTATFPSANDFTLIANPASRRVELFQQALAATGAPPARLIAFADVLENRVRLAEQITAGSVVKIESPGKDFAVEKLILQLGADDTNSHTF